MHNQLVLYETGVYLNLTISICLSLRSVSVQCISDILKQLPNGSVITVQSASDNITVSEILALHSQSILICFNLRYLKSKYETTCYEKERKTEMRG